MMQQDTLCYRCRSLENIIEDFEKPVPPVDSKPDGVDRSHQDIIPRNSISTKCRLCIQLYSLLRACASSNNSNAGVHELTLKCRYWWHPDLERLVAYHRISHHGLESYVFLRLKGALPLSIVDNTQADYKRLKYWFSSCKDYHKDCKSYERVSPAQQIELKAIDCTNRTICALPTHADYICLSYVWGSSKANAPSARTVKGKRLYELPKTIEDAIHVTLQLGINFLWVDRYCIDQNDPEEKHHMISNMDQIYLNATFTIIAAEGDGPHAGLPGICGTPRKQQRVIRTKQLTLVGIESVSQYVQHSKWNSRGWTYQEMLLSRRIILFTNTRIYYQCLSGFGLEGVTGAIQQRRREWNSNNSSWTEKIPGARPVFPILQGNLLGTTFLDRLSEYFERSLSFPADTVRATLGIFNVLRMTEAFHLNQFYGMPVVLHKGNSKTVTEDFVERLTWVAGTSRPEHTPGPKLGDDYGLPNTDLSTFMPGAELSERTELFPSWSWAAFKADCPEHEQAKGIRLIFPCSHKQVDTERCFDAADTEVRICRRNGTTARLSNFVHLYHDFENYLPCIDVTAWVWNDLFSMDMLKARTHTYNISLHFDDSRMLGLDPAAVVRLTAVHTVTYKTRCLHEEELHRVGIKGGDAGKKLTRAPSNPHERSYHIRMLLVKRNGFQTYARVGLLTLDTMWPGDSAPGGIEEVLKGVVTSTGDGSRSFWKRRTLRLV